MTSPATDANDRPSTRHPAVDRMMARWERCRDLMAGTDAIHAGREKYLPKHPREEWEDYTRRATRTELYNGFARTVRAMKGLVFQREPVLGDDVPAIVKEHWENIDGVGTHGAVFAGRLFEDALTTGLAGILVDYPAVESPELVSAADEEALALRPYWVPIRAEQIVSWRTEVVGGTVILSQLVLSEQVEEPAGRFGTALVTRYRVFRRSPTRVITWELWRKPTAEGQEAMVGKGVVRNLSRIPFVPVLVGPVLGYLETAPPLLDLADVNLAHYRVSADRRNLMHLACVPIPVREGYQPPAEGGAMGYGPNTLIDLPMGGRFYWAEVSGTAFAPTGTEIDVLERRMASLGMAFLMSETRAAETAEAKRIDSAAQNATLSSAARAQQDALEDAGALHAEYLQLADGGSWQVNNDFERTVLDPTVISTLATVQLQGQLSLETFLKILEMGHVLPEGTTFEEEAKKILEGIAALEAAKPEPIIVAPVTVDPNQAPQEAAA